MKLRNKRTGEIVDFSKGNFISSKDYGFVIYKGGGRGIEYNSLAELNNEWEDAPEEPKDFWYIKPNGCGERDNLGAVECDIPREYYDKMVEIGNYFETKEEAEKAVEKLRAWKRLKDKGFKFDGWNGTEIGSNISYISELYYEGCTDDMDLLFGGEE